MSRTPEEIAAAQAALNRKPDDAELVQATYEAVDGSGHRIPPGTWGWRYLGSPRYAGPPDASSVTSRSYHWLCRDCGQRKGWESTTKAVTASVTEVPQMIAFKPVTLDELERIAIARQMTVPQLVVEIVENELFGRQKPR